MSDVTVVCCWTNESMYNDFVNTLKAQDVGCEIIGIDNRGNKGFTSCASAYNSVIDDIKTKYVIYSHQDILLNAPDVLSKFLSYLETLGHDDILGIAGVRFESPKISGIISDIRNPHPFLSDKLIFAGCICGQRVVGGITKCDALDECFFGGHTEHFRNYPFDSEICDNWHLYAVEACLNAKLNANAEIWVCSADVIHRSSGNANSAFVSGFCRLCRKYANDFPFIRASCGGSFTDEKSLKKFVRRYYFHLAPQVAFLRFLARTNAYIFMRKIYRTLKLLIPKKNKSN
ncbi:MAG: hypothetical protein IJG30_07765 [Synergistaceae bacterium]|nr:hypothetical protein [Synergistaceae bacterium]